MDRSTLKFIRLIEDLLIITLRIRDEGERNNSLDSLISCMGYTFSRASMNRTRLREILNRFTLFKELCVARCLEFYRSKHAYTFSVRVIEISVNLCKMSPLLNNGAEIILRILMHHQKLGPWLIAHLCPRGQRKEITENNKKKILVIPKFDHKLQYLILQIFI